MAAPAVATDTSHDDFTRSVKRNILSVAARQGMKAKDVAERLGWSEQKLSQRMTGHSRWLAYDLALVARTLDVTVDVLTAQSDEEFRRALSKIGYNSDITVHPLASNEQGTLFELDGTHYNTKSELAVAV